MLKALAYLWAFPNTFLGFLFIPGTLLSCGSLRFVQGNLEIQGGFTRWFLSHGLMYMQASALTLGHVILGQDQLCLDYTRVHEQVHVRQYERWGPFFLPAYFASSFWAWWKGKNPYRDNFFEIEAYRISG